MSDRTQEKTHGFVGDIKSALKGVKGTGDAIRGTVNESIDTAFNDKGGEVQNKAIKEKGISDMEQADHHFSQAQSAGTTTTSTSSGLRTGGMSGHTHTQATTTGAGAHSGAIGNAESTLPQSGLGGEPGASRNTY
jgi:hypothetical protein